MNIEHIRSQNCQADLKELTAEYNLSTQLKDKLVHLVDNSYNASKPAMLYEFNKYLPNTEEQLLLVITIT